MTYHKAMGKSVPRSLFTKSAAKGKGPPQKSSFSKSNVNRTPRFFKQAKHDVLYYTGYEPGVMTLFLASGVNEEKDSFRKFDLDQLREDKKKAAELNINNITYRKGEDGNQLPQSPTKKEYGWAMYISIIGEEDNTPEGRKEIAQGLVDEFNKNGNSKNYKYSPKKVILGDDLTAESMEPCSVGMLDKDVLELLLMAYPKYEPDEILKWDDIIQKFWEDIDHGKFIIKKYIDGKNI